MSGIFHPEGKFAHYGGKLADLMWLNILVFLCALPIITAGASFCGMHYVLLKLHRDEDIPVTRGFFTSFRVNFMQATIMSCVFSAAINLLLSGIRLVYSTQAFLAGRYLLPVALVIVTSIFNWSLILQSRYHNTICGTIRLAVITTLGHPIRSSLMLILALLPFAMLFVAAENLILVLMAGITFSGFVQTVLYNHVFLQLEENGEHSGNETEALIV